ncbi:hypothetical protein [Fructobacillus tropaeoli]|nr:hypothetical protein [Fructobacillus tropaeoli]
MSFAMTSIDGQNQLLDDHKPSSPTDNKKTTVKWWFLNTFD